jgi:hypothetical protein
MRREHPPAGYNTRFYGMKTSALPHEIGVSLSDAQRAALEAAVAFHATGQSQYARQAIAQRLLSEGFLEHPLKKLATAAAAK